MALRRHACAYTERRVRDGAAAARAWFCASGLLPDAVYASPTPAFNLSIDIHDITRIGPTYLEPWTEDRCLWRVRFPHGWEVRHGALEIFHLLDALGRSRGAITFMDGVPAKLSLTSRYMPEVLQEAGEHDVVHTIGVVDLGTFPQRVLWRSAPLPDDDILSDAAIDPSTDPIALACIEAEQWLDGFAPHWKDPFAYWDDGV